MGHINGHHISSKDRWEFGFFTTLSVERIKSFYLLLSRVLVSFRQWLNGHKGAEPTVIYRLMMISNATVQSKKVSLAVLYFPVRMPSACSRPHSLAITCLPILWRFFSQGVRSKVNISVAKPSGKVCKHCFLLFPALWSHLPSQKHVQQRGRTKKDHTKLCSVWHLAAWISCSPGTPCFQAYAKYL